MPRKFERTTSDRITADHRSLARSLGGAVLFALLFRAFIAEANVIPSGSMIPTLLIGDRIVVSKFTYGLKLPFVAFKLTHGREPRRGEVVVFAHPDSGETLVKRVVAVGGDTVAMERNTLIINGKVVPRRPLPGPCTYLDLVDPDSDRTVVRRCQAYEETLGGQRYTVFQHPQGAGFSLAPRRIPDGHVFMLGDNRDNSNDSRYWGTVPHSHLKGRAQLHLWSYGDPDGLRWTRSFSPIHHGQIN